MFVKLLGNARSRSLLATLLLLVCAFGILTNTGCRWFTLAKKKPVPAEPFKLPPFQLSENSVSLEIGVIDIPNSNADKLDELWKKADQQPILLETRKLLDKNSLQTAILSSQPPRIFWQLIDPKIQYESEDQQRYHEKWRHSQGLPQQKNIAALQKATLIDGKPHRYPTGPTMNQATWELELDHRRRSGSLNLVQCHFRITTFPQSDGSVRIRLTPEIHHGEKKPRIAVSDDSFYWEPSQDKLTIHELTINAQLRTGQTLLCGPTSRNSLGLGGLFFCSDNSQRVFFIRVTNVGTQHSLGLRESSEPLATPLD